MPSHHKPPSPLPKTLLLISTKSYFTPDHTLQYLRDLINPENGILREIETHRASLVFGLIPDFLTLHPAAYIINSTTRIRTPWPIILGAQDCSPEPSYGAHTGSIVPAALSALGVSIVELGHAERRRPPLSESDELVAAKAASACSNGLIPLICIGESEKPDLSGPLSMAVGTAMRQLSTQIISVLKAIPLDSPAILAYEPVWAIGAAEPAGVQYVGPVVQSIRVVVTNIEGRTGETRVVYGGSAGPGLWSGDINGGNGLSKWVDGMFLGRFAHEISGVKKVVDEVVATLGDR
jgi:triosephosphate isomerase (TIM)